MSTGACSSLRRGVIASVVTRKRMAQSPVKCVMYSIGLAVRSLFQARQDSQQSGASDNTKTATLPQRILFGIALIVLFEVHAGVEAGHLLFVAVEHQGGAAAQFAEPSLTGLAPTRMVDVRVDVGV